jgi:hypothetical protein
MYNQTTSAMHQPWQQPLAAAAADCSSSIDCVSEQVDGKTDATMMKPGGG